MIFGVLGGCCAHELVSLTVQDVERHGKLLLVNIRETKTKVARSFTISGSYYEIVKRYADLRPKKCVSNRFFVKHRQTKCTVQVIGINKFRGIPREIANYLQLAEPNRYTGTLDFQLFFALTNLNDYLDRFPRSFVSQNV